MGMNVKIAKRNNAIAIKTTMGHMCYFRVLDFLFGEEKKGTHMNFSIAIC